MYLTLNGSDNCTAIAPRPCNGLPMLWHGLEVVGLIIYYYYCVAVAYLECYSHTCRWRNQISGTQFWSQALLHIAYKTFKGEMYKGIELAAYHCTHYLGSWPADITAPVQVIDSIQAGLWVHCIWLCSKLLPTNAGSHWKPCTLAVSWSFQNVTILKFMCWQTNLLFTYAIKNYLYNTVWSYPLPHRIQHTVQSLTLNLHVFFSTQTKSNSPSGNSNSVSPAPAGYWVQNKRYSTVSYLTNTALAPPPSWNQLQLTLSS